MSELPKGWVEATLSDVCDLITDGTHHSPVNGPMGEFKYVTAKNIRKHGLDLQDITYVDAVTHREIYKRCPVRLGDVLYIKDGATTGLAIVNPLTEEFSLLSSVALIRPSAELLNEHFLRYQLNTRSVSERMTGDMTGSAIRRLTLTTIGRQIVAVSPLAEQKRIVAKLDALNTKSARARTELARIETLVSRYKQAVLSKAFSGELTKDWRQSNQATWPWRSESWKDCGETLNGRAFPSGDYRSSGVKLLRPGNLGPEGDVFWNEKNTRYLPPKYAAEFPKHFIKGEAVLINLTAQSLEDQFLGRACLSLSSDEFMLNQRIGLFRPVNMTNKFCLFSLKSADFRSFVDNGMNSGSLIQHVHTKQLEQYRFVVPDIEEQHEIVRRIEAAFVRIDRLESQAKRALDLVGKLDEAILAKAFRGELVPQDPANEPADKLLERIRSEREAAPKVRRGRGRKA